MVIAGELFIATTSLERVKYHGPVNRGCWGSAQIPRFPCLSTTKCKGTRHHILLVNEDRKGKRAKAGQ